MSTMRKLSFVWVGVFIAWVILSFTTCKNHIGMGGTVDITPPKITVTYPPPVSVIRNSFTLRGTIEDDTEVKSVTVVFTDRTGKPDSVFAILDTKSGTWKAVINSKDSEGQFPLKDGKHEFKIKVQDSSGKENETAAVMIIDNTAPFLVLDRPSTVLPAPDADGDTQPDVFGDQFLLVGQVSDVNSAAKLEITAQKKDGSGQKYSKSVNNIPPVIDITLDTFSGSKEKNLYRSLYGDTESGVQEFTYKLSVWDGAEEYESPDSNDFPKQGNKTDVYYLFDDLYDEVFASGHYKMQDLYAMLSGTYTNTSGRSAEDDKKAVESILKLLKDPKKKMGGSGEEAGKTGLFGLDPAKNPKFSIDGFKPFDISNIDLDNPEKTPPKVYPDGIISIKLLRNRDKTPFKDPAAGEYQIMVRKKDEAADKARPLSGFSFSLQDGVLTASGAVTGLELGEVYVVSVTGTDKGNNTMIPSRRKGEEGFEYCFLYASLGKAPEVTVSKINTTTAPQGSDSISEQVYVKKDSDLTFTALIKESAAASLTYRLLRNGKEEGKPITTEVFTGEKEFTITAGAFDQADGGAYQLKLMAYDAQSRLYSVEQTYHIIYDVKGPEIRIESPINDEKRNTDNRTLTVKGTANDYGAGLKSPVVVTLKKPDGTDVPVSFAKEDGAKEKNGESWELQPIDLSGLGEGSYTLTVTAEDGLGQKAGEVTHRFMYDAEAPLITNVMEMSRTDIDGGTLIHVDNLNTPITGTITETHGIEWVKIKPKGNDWSDNLLTTGNNVFSYQPVLTEGIHSFEIKVRDKSGKEDAVTVQLCADTQKPVFKKMQLGMDTNEITAFAESQANPHGVVTGSSTVAVKGTFFDAGAGLDSVKAVYTPQGASEKAVVFTPIADGDGMYRIDGALTVPLGTTDIIFTAYDKASPQKEQTWKARITVESEVLTVTLGIKNGEAGHYPENAGDLKDGAKHVKGPFTLSAQGAYGGNVPHNLIIKATKDGNPVTLNGFYTSATPAADIQLAADNNSITGFKSGKKGSPAPVYNVVFTPRSNQLDDGRYVFTLESGTVKTEYAVVVDTTGPAITPVTPQDGGIITAGGKVKAALSDVSGIKEAKAYYQKEGGSVQELVLAAPLYEAVLPSALAEGKYQVWFTAKDSLDKESTTAKMTVSNDTANPVLAGITVDGKGENTVYSKTGVLEVTGKATDTNGVEKVEILEGNIVKKTQTSISPAGEWTINFSGTDLADGSHKLTIRATDKAGKIAKVQKTVIVDKAEPSINFATVEGGAVTSLSEWQVKQTLKFEGTASDTGSGIEKVEAIVNSETPIGMNGTDSWSGYLTLVDGNNHTVKFRVTDKAGNSKDTEAKTIKVDTGRPTIELTTPANGQTLIKDSSYTVKVSTADVGNSGVKEVQYAQNAGFTSPSTQTASGGAVSILLSGISADTTYYFRAVDNAGNKSDAVRVTIQKDSVLPTVEFSSHQNNNEVNKKITIRGSAGDNNRLQSVKIVQVVGSSEIDLIGVSGSSGANSSKAEFAGTNAYNWKFDLDTKQYTDNADLTLKAIATDAAGNEKTEILTLKVNQDSDRPQIVITNLDSLTAGTYLTVNTLNFVIVDDDGEIEDGKFEITSVPASAGTLTKATGGWQYKFADDGHKQLSFKVTDKAGGVFETNAVLSLDKPRVYAKEISATDSEAAVVLNVDTNLPESQNPAIQFSESASYTSLVNLEHNTKFKAGTFYLQMKASDANGIKSIKGKIDESEVFTAVREGVPVGGIETWRASVVFTSAQEGTKELIVEITDNAGATAKVTRTIIVDATAPTVELKYPASNAPQSGTVTVQGGIDDGNDAAGVKPEGTKWKIVKTTDPPTVPSATDTEGWTDMKTSTVANWNFDFNFATAFGTDTHTAYGTPNEITRNYFDIPVYILTEDTVGNKAVRKISLLYNPDGDKPIMEILSPSANATVGGSIQVFGVGRIAVGTPADIGKVFIQFSKDAAFNETNCTINGEDWWKNGDGISVLGATAQDQDYLGSGSGASWRMEVNKKGKLNPGSKESWDLWFRVRGLNTNPVHVTGGKPGKFGEWSEPIKITIDKSAPTIGSKIPLKLEHGGVSSDYVPNMWIKGGYKLTGSLHDASGIKRFKLSGDLESGDEFTLDEAKAKNWLIEDGANPPDSSNTPNYKNYKMNIDLNLDNLTDTAKAKKEFKLKIEVIEGTDKDLKAEKEFTFRYDVDAPVGDFGGKIGISNKTFGSNSVDDAYIASLVGTSFQGKKLLIGNTLVSVTEVSGSTVSFAPSITAGSYNVIIYEPKTVITDTTWTARGVANDSGSEVKEVKVWVKENPQESDKITCTHGGATNKISRELGTQCTWEAQLNLSSIPDGRHKVYYEVIDNSNNSSGIKNADIFIRNQALSVSKIDLSTKMGAVLLAETNMLPVKKSEDSNKNFTAFFQNGTFMFKSINDSKIKLQVLGPGEGAKTYSMYHGGTVEADGKINNKGTLLAGHTNKSWPADNTITLTLADFTAIGNSSGDELKTLVIEIRDSYIGITPSDPAPVLVAVQTKFGALDTEKPGVVMLPFHWNSETDNSLYQNKRENGHVEIGNITGMTGSSVSGKVTLRGFAYDNVKITKITATVPNSTPLTFDVNMSADAATWNSTDQNMAAHGVHLTVEKLAVDYTGFYVKWQLDWDTEKAAVGTGKDIKVIAFDGTNSSTADDITLTNNTEVSTVASITRDTELSAENAVFASAKIGQFVEFTNGDESYLRRIATKTGNVITFTKDVPKAANTVNLYAYNANQTKRTVSIVPYITEIETLVSGNAGKEFARSAKGSYPVYTGEKIKLYGFNLTQKPVVKMGSETLTVGDLTGGYYPVTVSSTEKSGFLDIEVGGVKAINNINAYPVFDEKGNPTKVPYNVQANTANKYLNDDIKLAIWKLEDFGLGSKDITSPIMKMDKGGKWYMSYGEGIPRMKVNKNGFSTRVDHSFNKFHNTTVAFDEDGNIYAAATNTDRINDDSAKFAFYSRAVESTTSDSAYTNSWPGKSLLEQVFNQDIYNINRVKRPKMVVTGNTASAKVYMAYFDSNHPNNPVKFRYGTVNASNNFSGGISSYGGFHTVADKESSYKGGEYAAVGVTSTGVAVVAWYDASEKRLVYSYNDAPQTAVQGGVWQTNAKVIDSGYAGWYVDLTVDENDGIHIAYYNSAKGDLKYAYLSSYNAPSAEVVTVDSYLSVGTQIMITTRQEGANNVPYISYYHPSFTQTTSSVRVAWRTDFTALKDGAKDDSFTGAWEAMTVPTQDVPKEETVCHGVPTVSAWTDKMMLGFMTYDGYKKATLKK